MSLMELFIDLERLVGRLDGELTEMTLGELSKHICSPKAKESLDQAIKGLEQTKKLLGEGWKYQSDGDVRVNIARLVADVLENMGKAFRASSEEFGKEKGDAPLPIEP